MGSTVIARALIVVVAAGVALAWTLRVEPDPTQQDPAPVTLTGCLRSGSAAQVFILRSATAPDTDVARDYLLVEIAEGIDLNAHMNHQVAITGRTWRAADGPAPPEAANTAERALRRLDVRELQHVAPNCSTPPVG